MNGILKDTLKLFLITLVSGVCLSFVYEMTKKPIADAELEEKAAAYKDVYPQASGFFEIDGIAQKLSSSADELEAAGISGTQISDILGVSDGGYVLTSSSFNGYGGEIKIAMGVDQNGVITGVTILSMSETPGLGAKCTEESFYGQFTGIKADNVKYSKTGKSASDEIDAISGATKTTQAVTDAVNAGLWFVRSLK